MLSGISSNPRRYDPTSVDGSLSSNRKPPPSILWDTPTTLSDLITNVRCAPTSNNQLIYLYLHSNRN